MTSSANEPQYSELTGAELDHAAGGASVVEVARLAALAACLAGGGQLTDHATELK